MPARGCGGATIGRRIQSPPWGGGRGASSRQSADGPPLPLWLCGLGWSRGAEGGRAAAASTRTGRWSLGGISGGISVVGLGESRRISARCGRISPDLGGSRRISANQPPAGSATKNG